MSQYFDFFYWDEDKHISAASFSDLFRDSHLKALADSPRHLKRCNSSSFMFFHLNISQLTLEDFCKVLISLYC